MSRDPADPKRPQRRLNRLSALVPGMIEPALRQRGFASAALLSEWAEIAGAQMAGFTTPLELRWPKKREPGKGEPVPRGRMQEKAEGATLVIACPGAFALEAQMASARIIEAANRRFGFRAITKLEIRQIAPPEKRNPARETPIPPALARQISADCADILDENLRRALGELGAGIARRTGSA